MKHYNLIATGIDGAGNKWEVKESIQGLAFHLAVQSALRMLFERLTLASGHVGPFDIHHFDILRTDDSFPTGDL